MASINQLNTIHSRVINETKQSWIVIVFFPDWEWTKIKRNVVKICNGQIIFENLRREFDLNF